jgi:hypothetical protein
VIYLDILWGKTGHSEIYCIASKLGPGRMDTHEIGVLIIGYPGLDELYEILNIVALQNGYSS